jgi:integrase
VYSMKIDLIDAWLTVMGASHSGSLNTKLGYKKDFGRYLEFVQMTPEQILEDYRQNDIIKGNQIIRKKDLAIQNHTQALTLYLSKLNNDGYLPSSRQNAIHAIRSFYKYNNLPLGNIELGKRKVVLHNRDITKEEMEEIIKAASPREQAFYALMVQTGLRPQTLCLLKIGDVEGITEEKTPIPALIKVSEEQTKGEYGAYWTFAGTESVLYLKEYLKRRNVPFNPDEFLFTHDKNDLTPINTDIVSHLFRRTITKLRDEGVIDFKGKESKLNNRNELRLYNLRKYFRNHAGSGFDFVNFWMGHIAKLGVDSHYFSKDDNKENIEKHRKLYAETAMKNLRIENRTPGETENTIINLQKQLANKDKEIEALNKKFDYIMSILAPIEKMGLIADPEKSFPEQLRDEIDSARIEYLQEQIEDSEQQLQNEKEASKRKQLQIKIGSIKKEKEEIEVRVNASTEKWQQVHKKKNASQGD